MSQQHHKQCDVLIIGAGPAGLSLARGLAPSGLSIVLVETHPESVLANPPYDGREIALTHYSRETMQAWDMWDKVPANEIYRLKDARVLNGRSNYQLHFPQPTAARGKPADSLGFLISNHNIRRAAYEAVKPFANVTLMCEHNAVAVQTTSNQATVTLDNGSQITCQLLVAADSRFSQTRRLLGIAADSHDFGRTVLVFRMRHTLSNNHSAFECFHYGRTLALLPLESNLTNCVVTIDNDKATALMAMNGEELAADITRELNGRLGDMTLVSSIHHYPLVGVHAQAFYGQRSALIGDAAVGMHPVTAHGFNLGLASAKILSELVTQAAQQHRDIGSNSLLAQYQRRHMPHTRMLYHGTNAMVTLFTNDAPPARLLRSLVLRASNHCPPVKRLISKQLTG
ncbi:5-demethoxyubiquinol-8 5-hydroxylase UbiM [Snodgrassella sp. CFCC 13594]|uniref:5-demethoxyubiquinol-8 5-hydroxylase UbiM n=1 Tax=Snodgrassella sp. CFCC 13594 TaxID=1775559 RepID=UPI00082B270D|nr:5-demethoxyubiquinol-8 5-hydroxylase UbiM [Snodgrassella sp. CFCC 13594]